MKRIIAVVFFTFSAAMGSAMAACTEPTRVADVLGALQNMLICGGATSGDDKWQEEHHSSGGFFSTGGILRERAKGASDPVDPSKDIGNWAVQDNNTATAKVCYTYSGGSMYCFSLHSNGGSSYSFCDGGSEVATGILKAIPGDPEENACGFF